jgi:hypothetical protein
MGGTAALLARGADNGDQRFVGIGLDHARCADPRPARAYPALHARRERISLVHGLRSVSRVHRNKPYVFGAGHEEHRVDYVPGEGTSYLLAATPLARPDLVSDQLPQHRSTRALPPFLRQ